MMGHYNYYAEQSATRIGKWMIRTARRRQLARILPHLAGEECAILEIGPGFGELTDALLEAGYRNCTVVEPNDLLRQRLEQKKVRTRSYRIPPIREEDCTYDAIVLFHVLEHLSDASDAQLFVAEAARVLQPGGLVCILSPDYLQFRQDFFNVDYTHSYVTTVRRVSQLLHDGGFHVLTHTYYSGLFAGTLAKLISTLVRIGLCCSVGNDIGNRLYKLKTSLLRSFLIIARKA